LHESIRLFIAEYCGSETAIDPQESLFESLGLFGDDVDDFMEAYASKFHVDMSSYLWYFHTGEEGLNFGSFFFKPPYSRVAEIPVTIEMLSLSANSKRWIVDYPPHNLPKRRYDLLVNLALVMAVALFFILALIYW